MHFVTIVALLSVISQYGFIRSSHTCPEAAFNTDDIVLANKLTKDNRVYRFKTEIGTISQINSLAK